MSTKDEGELIFFVERFESSIYELYNEFLYFSVETKDIASFF